MTVMMRFSLDAGPLLSRWGQKRGDGGEAVRASRRDNDQISALRGESDAVPGRGRERHGPQSD